MNDVVFIAHRIAAQTIRMSEVGIRKLASILIRKELKEGAIFLDENETCEQMSYIYKENTCQYYFKNKKDSEEHSQIAHVHHFLTSFLVR